MQGGLSQGQSGDSAAAEAQRMCLRQILLQSALPRLAVIVIMQLLCAGHVPVQGAGMVFAAQGASTHMKPCVLSLQA